MNYKKIFKTGKSREFVLTMLRFIPDSLMLKLQYKIKSGRNLDLNNPKRFTEKIQWYKINYRNPIMHKCVDKYHVREFIKEKDMESILVPLIKKYNEASEIVWDDLPNRFVIKTTQGSGGLNVLVCPDKTMIEQEKVIELLTVGQKNYRENSGGREWAYYGLKPGIVVEKLLYNKENPESGINDYKIFCYDGIPKYIIVDVDRYIGHKRNFYDTNWNNLHVTSDCPAADREIEKPKNLSEMLKIAAKLSEGFPYVRVDLYNDSGKIYFGELTFYPWSGYVQFSPDEWDYRFAEDFNLDRYEQI